MKVKDLKLIDLKNSTKNEIIDYLLKNELKEIQSNFYSFIKKNKYNMILSIIDTIFTTSKSNLSKNPGFIGNTEFEKFNVRHLFKPIRSFQIDRIYIVNDEDKNKASFLSPGFAYNSNPYFSKDLFVLMGKDVHIKLYFKVKNRWYRFIIDEDSIEYKTYKKMR